MGSKTSRGERRERNDHPRKAAKNSESTHRPSLRGWISRAPPTTNNHIHTQQTSNSPIQTKLHLVPAVGTFFREQPHTPTYSYGLSVFRVVAWFSQTTHTGHPHTRLTLRREREKKPHFFFNFSTARVSCVICLRRCRHHSPSPEPPLVGRPRASSPGFPSPGSTGRAPPTPPCRRAVVGASEAGIPGPENEEKPARVRGRIKTEPQERAQREPVAEVTAERTGVSVAHNHEERAGEAWRFGALSLGVDTWQIGSFLPPLVGFTPGQPSTVVTGEQTCGSKNNNASEARGALESSCTAPTAG